MPRKTMQYVVEDKGRDHGKVFLLTEMSASAAERWALRAFLALSRSGVQISRDTLRAGMAGMAENGLALLLGHLSYDEAQLLMDEMLTCVQFVPNPAQLDVRRALIEDDIEEVTTRIKLRLAVFQLHVDFSKAAAPSTSTSASAATGTGSPTTKTSQSPSPR